MSSQGSTREEERRFNVRTLVIASVASAAAAVVTSQFWIRGTPIAAAVTPVIVTLVSEMLHRPTAKIVEKFTTETDALPEAAGAGQPPREEAVRPEPARDQPEPRQATEAPIRIYRQPTATTAAGRKLPWRTILVTGALAFVIAAAVLTLPELIAGQSIGKGNGTTSILGNRNKDKNDEETPATRTETVPAETETVTEPQPTTPQPQQRSKPPATTTPQSTSTQTTPAPAPRSTP